MPEEGEIRQINSASALWQRPKSELKAEDYTQAYRAIAGAFDEPAMTLHYRAEGRQSYAVLLFAPSTKPFDLFEPNRKGHIKLYVRRVFITDDAELLPNYLRFIRGVVDSEDLPLNISREMLQNNPQLAQIKRALTGRVVNELETLADKEPEQFNKIWSAFGAVLKEGLVGGSRRREQILKFARFTTTSGEGRTLKQYLEGLKPNQTEIYYLVGEGLDRLKSNPKLEAARARGIEVLLLTDPGRRALDLGAARFRGQAAEIAEPGRYRFRSDPAERARPPRPDEAPAVDEAMTIAIIKTALGDKVTDVRASKRLTDSAACLVAEGKGPDRELDKLLARHHRANALKAGARDQHPPSAGRGDPRSAGGEGRCRRQQPVAVAVRAGANPRRRNPRRPRRVRQAAERAGAEGRGEGLRSRVRPTVSLKGEVGSRSDRVRRSSCS